MYSSVALDTSGRIGSSLLYVVCVGPCRSSPRAQSRLSSARSQWALFRQLLLVLRSSTLPSARSQWALPTAGNIDGEIIETLWAFLNRISGSIRAMATSHRKEVLDDHMNEINWRKTVGMGTRLSVPTSSHRLTRP